MLTLNAQQCEALKQMLLEVPAKWAIPILNFLESVREQQAIAEKKAAEACNGSYTAHLDMSKSP